MTQFLGLGKTLFNASACLIRDNPKNGIDVEIALVERLTRHKASGAWPEAAIRHFLPRLKGGKYKIADNRDVIAPYEEEDRLNQILPFFSYIKAQGLSRFVHQLNPSIQTISHHLAHAKAAVTFSPFDKALIVVIDGAGSSEELLLRSREERSFVLGKGSRRTNEHTSVYSFNKGVLRCLEKRFLTFKPSQKNRGHVFTDGPGLFYEEISNYVFLDLT